MMNLERLNWEKWVKKETKGLISLILVFALVISIFPQSTFAMKKSNSVKNAYAKILEKAYAEVEESNYTNALGISYTMYYRYSDINNDGTEELIVLEDTKNTGKTIKGSNHSGDKTRITIYTYYKGKVIELIGRGPNGDKNKKELYYQPKKNLICSYISDNFPEYNNKKENYQIYKIEKGKLKKVKNFTVDGIEKENNKNTKYYIDNKSVTREKFKKDLKQYRKTIKNISYQRFDAKNSLKGVFGVPAKGIESFEMADNTLTIKTDKKNAFTFHKYDDDSIVTCTNRTQLSYKVSKDCKWTWNYEGEPDSLYEEKLSYDEIEKEVQDCIGKEKNKLNVQVCVRDNVIVRVNAGYVLADDSEGNGTYEAEIYVNDIVNENTLSCQLIKPLTIPEGNYTINDKVVAESGEEYTVCSFDEAVKYYAEDKPDLEKIKKQLTKEGLNTELALRVDDKDGEGDYFYAAMGKKAKNGMIQLYYCYMLEMKMIDPIMYRTKDIELKVSKEAKVRIYCRKKQDKNNVELVAISIQDFMNKRFPDLAYYHKKKNDYYYSPSENPEERLYAIGYCVVKNHELTYFRETYEP